MSHEFNNLNIRLDENLYKRLPKVYQYEDAKALPYADPLKRFLKILGEGGFNELERYIVDLSNLFNPDLCPTELLPLVAKTLGLDLEYFAKLPETTQRKFLKSLPYIYKNKGSDKSFNYLARELFGHGASASTYTANFDPSTMTMQDWAIERLKIFVRILANGDDPLVAYTLSKFSDNNQKKHFEDLIELIRPVNSILVPHFALFFLEEYQIGTKFNDTRFNQNIFTNNLDTYDKEIQIFEPSIVQVKQVLEEEVYNRIMRAHDDMYPITLNRGVMLNSRVFGLGHSGLSDTVTYAPQLDQYDRLIKAKDEALAPKVYYPVETDIFNRVINGDLEASTTVTYTRASTKIAPSSESRKLVTDFYTNNLNHYSSFNY